MEDDALTKQREAEFAKKIFERLDSEETDANEALDEDRCQYFKQIQPKYLRSLIEIYVDSKIIPLPPDNLYTDHIHRQVRAFLNEICKTDILRLRDRPVELEISGRALEYSRESFFGSEFYAPGGCIYLSPEIKVMKTFILFYNC